MNYRYDARAPLLFIAGGADNVMPPSVNESNAKHYKSDTDTDYKEFPSRSHWTCGEPGWEELPTTPSSGRSSTRAAAAIESRFLAERRPWRRPAACLRRRC